MQFLIILAIVACCRGIGFETVVFALLINAAVNALAHLLDD